MQTSAALIAGGSVAAVLPIAIGEVDRAVNFCGWPGLEEQLRHGQR
jgi:hypothetical protein